MQVNATLVRAAAFQSRVDAGGARCLIVKQSEQLANESGNPAFSVFNNT
jgi:hypothetical protein